MKDSQIKDFEKNDVGNDIENSNVKPKIVKSNRQLPTSINLSKDLIAQLKTRAKKKGIAYQTLLKMIVYENIKNY